MPKPVSTPPPPAITSSRASSPSSPTSVAPTPRPAPRSARRISTPAYATSRGSAGRGSSGRPPRRPSRPAPTSRPLARQFPDRCRGAVAGAELRQQDAAAPSMHQIGADDLVDPVIRALDQHVRLERPDQLDRRVLAEHDDQIDRAERRQHG